MKFMSTWSFQGGVIPDAAERFLAGEGTPEPGTTLLGRWHNADLSGGFALYETSDPAALYRGALKWADLLDINTVPVIEDADAGAALACPELVAGSLAFGELGEIEIIAPPSGALEPGRDLDLAIPPQSPR